jgi:hypothetical protein
LAAHTGKHYLRYTPQRFRLEGLLGHAPNRSCNG